jgi:hypothetical protein
LTAAPHGEPDPDALLAELRQAAGAPPLPPLSVGDPSPSARRGPAGALVSRARRAVVRLLSPVLGDLISQVERDRHRQRAEMARLEKRISLLEAERDARRGETDRTT